MKQMLTPSTEDYLETILLISRELPGIRVKDISSRMGVSMPSVNSAIKNLAGKGMVVFERYGNIQLTAAGREEGERIYSRHTALTSFFIEVLGMEGPAAEADACRIEHHISREAMQQIVDFGRFFAGQTECAAQWREYKKRAVPR